MIDYTGDETIVSKTSDDVQVNRACDDRQGNKTCDDRQIYNTFVDESPVRGRGYLLFAGFTLSVILIVAFYLLGTDEVIVVFAGMADKEVKASVKEKVTVLLDEVARLRSQSSFDSAYVLLRDFHEVHPEEPNINVELGWHNMEKGLFVFAAEYYALAREVIPNNSKLNFYSGELHLRWGNNEMDKTKNGSIDFRKKIKYIERATKNFSASVKYFTASVKGTNCFNIERSKEKLQQVRKILVYSQYKKLAFLSMNALATDNVNRTLLKQYHSEFTNLLKEEVLGSDLKQQIINRQRDLMREQ